MREATSDFIEVIHRVLPYSTFDADNHLYENQDALTKFVPPQYEGIIRYVEVNGRTKIAIRNTISDFIPNPTFGRVAVPGAAGYDVTKGGHGLDQSQQRVVGMKGGGGKKMVSMPGIDAFFDPEPRLAL